MKWQPIETAPTDGTRILLRGRNGRIADGHYGQPDGFANPKRFVWPYINATPTHWAPLALVAAAPVARGGNEGERIEHPDRCAQGIACRHRQGPRHSMLTGPEVLILCAFLAALYMWDWWRRNWKGD